MDKALFVTATGAVPDGDWSHLYFGSEFCPWTFPATPAFLNLLDTARNRGCRFTLVTPVITEPFLPRLEKTLKTVLPRLDADDEVVVSDIGAISLVRDISADVKLVVGRVLSGQKRGPRILGLDLSAEEADYFRRGSWYQAEAVAFLKEWNIHRVELDNLLQGIAPLPAGLAGSLHLPWAMVTSSRNCPFREPGQDGPCAGGCGEVMKLTTPQTDVPLYQAGNTQFLQNDKLPSNLAELGIDRIVEHRSIPR